MIFSLHIRSMWETTVMHKQVSGWTVNFGPNFPESPFLELKTRKPPSLPFQENFRFGMTKVYSRIPPSPFWKTLDLGWSNFTLEYLPPILENFRFGMTKTYSGLPPPHFGKLQIWNDQSLLRNTPPHFRKLQIFDDQSLLLNPPPFWKTSDLEWWKFTPEYPPFQKTSDLGWPKFTLESPPPFWKTSDLGWPKFTPESPPHFGKLQIWNDESLLRNTPLPILENFRFGMIEFFSGIPPPPFWKTSDLGWPNLLRITPTPFWKTSDLEWPKFTLEYPPPISENFRFGMTKVYSWIPPPFWKTSDLEWPKFTLESPPPFWKTSDLEWRKFTPEYPPFQKTSDLGWPKFTLESPPILENFRFGMTKVYSGIPPPHFGKLQIWNDESLLRNTPPFQKTSDLGWPKFTLESPPPISENFRFGMTKVYSGIPPLPMKIVRESKSESFRIPRVTTCGDFIQPG